MNLGFVTGSLFRHRKQYILFGLLFLFLGAAWLLSTLLGSAADALRQDFIDQYGTAVVLEDVGTTPTLIDKETCDMFNDPDIVESIEYVNYTQASVLAYTLTAPVSPPFDPARYIHMAGYDYHSIYSPFTRRANPYTITQGRMPEADNECMIFDDVYEHLVKCNAIKQLGDAITIRSYLADEAYFNRVRESGGFPEIQLPPDYIDRELIIVGTVDRNSVDHVPYQIQHKYDISSTGEVSEGKLIPYVFFVTMNEALQYPCAGSTETGALQLSTVVGTKLPQFDVVSHAEAIFHLKSYDDFPAFRDSVVAYNHKIVDERLYSDFERGGLKQAGVSFDTYLGIPQFHKDLPYFSARPYLEGLDEIIASLAEMHKFSSQMSLNLSLLTAALFIILTALNLYARTYEIGVLRCVGMSRLRISLNLMVEQGIFLLGSLLLGILLSTLLAGGIIPHLFDAAYRDYLQNALTGLPAAAATILASGLLFTLLAAAASAVFIQRYRPLAILRNRC